MSIWEDSQINPNMMRVCSRKHHAQEALNDYRESVRQQLVKLKESSELIFL